MHIEAIDYAVKIKPAGDHWLWSLLDQHGNTVFTGQAVSSQGAVEQALAAAKALSS